LDNPQGVLVQGDIGKELIMLVTRQPMAATARIKLLLKIAIIVGIAALLNYGGHLVVGRIEFQLWPEHDHMVVTMFWFSVAAYVLLMALPFAPGIELGLALMMVLGPRGVVLVYVCTLLSLSLSFMVGRLIPLEVFARFLGWLHLKNARDLLIRIGPLDSEQKLNCLLNTAPPRIIPFLLKHRYLLVAFILNLPGNALVGGGGGIGVIAGMSGLYPFLRYLLLIGMAILPLPLFFSLCKM
jgi:hypothetical protein